MKCLVTGAGGFIGRYLVEKLLERGCEVFAVDQAAPDMPAASGLHCMALDVQDAAQTTKLFEDVRPEAVFHLAAQSYPGASWEQPALTYNVNVLGSIHVMEAARRLNPAPRTLVVCSSAEYVEHAGAEPIREDTLLRPTTPYGISKLAEDHAALLYHQHYGLPTIRIRPFFLIGPRKRGDVSSDFARGIVAIERGVQETLSVGNLEIVRDLLDVRDGVEAFWTLAQKGVAGEVYNICSGQGYSLRQVLDRYRALAVKPVREQLDPKLIRPIDEKARLGDPGKLKALGWVPAIPIERTIEDILVYWRAQAT
ncbi:MAG TPA: GDP-mannose 4,6-dehydratase [Verrucomicrobia bacterium]|nr:GDP-mannose 4,6-dehydratase [Verrucomicrobiota bacterium]